MKLEVIVADAVTIKKAVEIWGFSEIAIRSKIADGKWIEGREWKWSPDGVQLIIVDGVNKWVMGPGKASMRGRRQSSSTSDTRAKAA